MIPLIVVLPILFAFLVTISTYLGVDRIYREGLFLLGIFSPIPVFILEIDDLPVNRILGGWGRIAGIEVAIDQVNYFFLLAALIVFPMVAMYSLNYFDKTQKQEGNVDKHSKFILILLLYGGVLGSFLARDLFDFAVYMEIASISAIILVASSSSEKSKLASFRYLVLYLLSSFFFFFSIGLIYVKTGYLNFHLIQQNLVMSKEIKAAISIAFIALIIKAGIFPLHFWLPGAHSKADTPVSALLSGVSVKVPIYGMILFVHYTSVQFLTLPLMVVAFTSMISGIILALFQNDVKKLLAYSTVSQMGFVLIGISTLNIYAVSIYVLAHALVKSGLFLSVGILISSKGHKKINRLSLKNKKILIIPIILLSLGIGGISPLLGGYAKYNILTALSGFEVYLFYLGSIGTLTLFTMFNYELFDLRGDKKIDIGLEEVIISLIALLTVVFGIYYNLKFKLLDVILISSAILIFPILEYSGLLERNLPKFYEENMNGLGKQINFYTAVIVVMTIFFLFFVLFEGLILKFILIL